MACNCKLEAKFSSNFVMIFHVSSGSRATFLSEHVFLNISSKSDLA